MSAASVTAAGAPTVPASPQPSIPIGFAVEGTSSAQESMNGASAAGGSASSMCG